MNFQLVTTLDQKEAKEMMIKSVVDEKEGVKVFGCSCHCHSIDQQNDKVKFFKISNRAIYQFSDQK